MLKNVLLVDDDQDDAALFSKALEELGEKTNFRYWGNGCETLAELVTNQEFIPDIIFLDIHMPVTNGWECVREFKAIAALRQTPVVMYSSADMTKIGMRPDDVGVSAFMVKPGNFEELKNRLSLLLQELASGVPV